MSEILARVRAAAALGHGDAGRSIHVVCSPKDDYLAVITGYLPDADQWSSDFKARN